MARADVRILPFLALWLPLVGCDEPAGEDADPCEALSQQLIECELVLEPLGEGECNGEQAEALAEVTDCEALASMADTAKADGWWEAFLCEIGYADHCPLPAIERTEDGRFTRYDLPGDRLHPEGGTFDAVDGAFYVGSLDDGRVLRIDAASRETTEVVPPNDEGWRTLGAAVDEERRRVFFCVLHDEDPLAGQVWEIDLDRQERVAEYDLTDAAPNGSCNDVAVAPDGSVYVTDREAPNLYRVRDGEVSVFATDDVLAPPTVGLGQNGIVVLPDGSGIVTTRYLPPALNFISLDDPSDIRRVDIDGDFSDYNHLGSGADGMVWFDDSLFVVMSTELFRVSSDDGWRTATSNSVSTPRSGMTDVVVAERDLYLLNGQAVHFVTGREPGQSFYLMRFADALP